eukprot:10279019-Alexandrium_andersonii.AAC.1
MSGCPRCPGVQPVLACVSPPTVARAGTTLACAATQRAAGARRRGVRVSASMRVRVRIRACARE